jgi:hypothetical protein
MGCSATVPALRTTSPIDCQPVRKGSNKVKAFQVVVEKDEHTSLGGALMEKQKQVIILGIADNGSIQDWNRKHPDKQVLPGDRIVAVNGVDTGYYAMAAELWKTGSLVLHLERDLGSPAKLQRTDSRIFLAEHAARGARLDMRCPVDDLPHMSAGSCGATECAICFEDYDSGDTRVVQLPCGHSFHPVCAARWFSQGNPVPKRTCPLCKQEA